MNPSFSIREALRVGWQKTVSNLGRFFLILLCLWLVSALANGFWKHSAPIGRPLAALIFVLGLVLQILLEMGFVRSVLKVLDGGKPAVADFQSNPMEFLKFLATAALCGIAVLIGFVLVIIPGIILAIRLQFFPYLVLEQKLSPVEALKRSWMITRGQTWRLFLFGLVLAAIGFLGAALIGIGLFIAVPVISIASAFIYRKLSSGSQPATAAVTVAPAQSA